MHIYYLDAKDSAEIIPLVRTITDSGKVISKIAISVVVIAGIDSSQNAILSGAPTINAGQWAQMIAGGIPGTTYKLRAVATFTDNTVYVETFILQITEF